MGNLTGAVMLNSDPTVPDGTVTLRIGSLLAVAAPAPSAPSLPSPPGAPSTTGQPASTVAPAPITTIPVPNGQTPSSAVDQAAPYDPVAC